MNKKLRKNIFLYLTIIKIYLMDFQTKYSFDQRKFESFNILQKYHSRLPIILSYDNKEFYLDKCKYLVPSNFTVGQFMFFLRQNIKLDSAKSIFIFVNKTIPPTNAVMSDIYNKYHDLDGFLYFSIKGENTFGK